MNMSPPPSQGHEAKQSPFLVTLQIGGAIILLILVALFVFEWAMQSAEDAAWERCTSERAHDPLWLQHAVCSDRLE